MKVKEITNEQIQKIRAKTPEMMYGNRPNMEGFKPHQIRENLSHVLLDPTNSIIALISDLIGEINISKEDIVVLQTTPENWDEYSNEVLFIIDSQTFYYVTEDHNPIIMDMTSKYTLFSAGEIPKEMRISDFCFLYEQNPEEVARRIRAKKLEPIKRVNKTSGSIISTPMMNINGTKMNIMTTTTRDDEKVVTTTTMTLLRK